MIYQEIINTYKKMGIGTQEERNQFLQWYPETITQNNNLVFIIESPNSETVKEGNNAQLARNFK
ncbi:MAG: hypothetical protein ABH886_07395 [Candidatus Desantisbacteria bacterium]